MTRPLPAGMATEIDTGGFRPLVLLKFEFDSGDLRLWNGYRPFTFQSEVYTGAGHLLEVTGIQETLLIKATNVTFVISGLEASAINVALTENYQQRPVTLWVGALDANENIIDDAFRQFQGLLDVMTPEDDGVTATISVTAENELVDLERSRERRNTDEDQELDYPNDRIFEFVEGLQNKEIVVQ